MTHVSQVELVQTRVDERTVRLTAENGLPFTAGGQDWTFPEVTFHALALSFRAIEVRLIPLEEDAVQRLATAIHDASIELWHGDPERQARLILAALRHPGDYEAISDLAFSEEPL